MNGIQILCTLMTFQYYVHHMHWIVKGDESYMYHLLYDRIYGSTGDLIDEYAEYLVGVGEGGEIPFLLTDVEKLSVIEPPSTTDEYASKDKILAGAKALKKIAEMDGRDRTESRILDDISGISSTAIYLLQQTVEEEDEK